MFLGQTSVFRYRFYVADPLPRLRLLNARCFWVRSNFTASRIVSRNTFITGSITSTFMIALLFVLIVQNTPTLPGSPVRGRPGRRERHNE